MYFELLIEKFKTLEGIEGGFTPRLIADEWKVPRKDVMVLARLFGYSAAYNAKYGTFYKKPVIDEINDHDDSELVLQMGRSYPVVEKENWIDYSKIEVEEW